MAKLIRGIIYKRAINGTEEKIGGKGTCDRKEWQ